MLRGISLLSPLRYFIDFAFGVILKGNGLSLLLAREKPEGIVEVIVERAR